MVATVTLNPAIDRTLVVEDLKPGSVNRARWSEERAGGKGVNVAAALAERGQRCVALGFLGADNAEVFERFFSVLGIEDRCVRLPGATRTGLKVVDPVRGETTDLNFPGLTPTAANLADLRRSLDAVKAEWCVLAGSLPPGVPADYYAESIRRLRARGVRVGLDTSGESLRQAVPAGPDFIKPNLHELAELVGRPLPDTAAVEAAASELCALGVGLVVVSCGADGAVFTTATQRVWVKPPIIAVRSTVGAGDAMVAGVVAAQLEGLSLEETGRRATQYALGILLRGETPEKLAEAMSGVRVA
ncbi:MAG: 1-phosphofructokinase [Verrucomicrobia bacterium]|nr:1-phosphofructokinase [Verrucomicrobiota bacterium]